MKIDPLTDEQYAEMISAHPDFKALLRRKGSRFLWFFRKPVYFPKEAIQEVLSFQRGDSEGFNEYKLNRALHTEGVLCKSQCRRYELSPLVWLAIVNLIINLLRWIDERRTSQ